MQSNIEADTILLLSEPSIVPQGVIPPTTTLKMASATQSIAAETLPQLSLKLSYNFPFKKQPHPPFIANNI